MTAMAGRTPEDLFDGFFEGLAVCRAVERAVSALGDASVAVPREVTSDRVKEVAHPSRQVWMHHLELRDASQVDEQVRAWLQEAYDAAE